MRTIERLSIREPVFLLFVAMLIGCNDRENPQSEAHKSDGITHSPNGRPDAGDDLPRGATTMNPNLNNLQPDANMTSPNTTSSVPIVSLTPKAADQLRQYLAQEAGRYTYVRVGVERGGPTGFMYDFRLEETANADVDWLGESHGVKILVDRASAIFVEGPVIDWISDDDGNQGFKFHNPNAMEK